MRRLLYLLALLLPGAALAADGDIIRTYGSGAYCVQEVLLCDGDHIDGSASNNGCPSDIRWDLHWGAKSTATAAASAAQGMPEYFVVEIRADNGTATTGETLLDVFGYDESDGTGAHQLNSTALEFGTAVTSLTVNPTTHRYINLEVDTEGDGTDLEVVLRTFTPKTARGVKCPGT